MLRSMLRFIEKSPTCFHAVSQLSAELEQNGYRYLTEGEWELEPGACYYTTRNGSSLIAFRIPRERPSAYMLTASHTDSPCFRLRDHADLPGSYARLSVEKYGGQIQAPWLDRPLSVAGRVLVRQGNKIQTRLVDFEKPVALIPNPAIHLNRDMNNGLRYDEARDLFPLFGMERASFRDALADKLSCEKEDILASDLFIYNPQPGVIWGPGDEFVTAPRLDDLSCVFSCLQGFLKGNAEKTIPVFCAFDNEEIGSGTKQGAESMFLPDTLQAICDALGISRAQHRELLGRSMLLSCDNGHARHPNRPELADQTEAPMLNGGPVIKHSVRYATDGVSAAVFSEICRRADVPVQHYSNRPDQAGGATLGNIANTKTGVSTVDIGMAQLAMHSACETMGSRDVERFAQAVAAFYSAVLETEGEGSIVFG